MRVIWLLLRLILFQFLSIIHGEVVLIPNWALYHVTPITELQLKHLNKLRTSDSGFIFIHGVGTVGDTVEILTTPQNLKLHTKELTEHKLEFDMQFHPVNIEMFNNNTKSKSDIEPPEMTEEAFEARKRGSLLPIENIVEPDVFSGVFLRIVSPFYPDLDVIQLSTRANSTMGNPMLCIPVNNKDSDFNGDSDPSTQWIFEKTENDGFYILRNKLFPNNYVSWEDDEDSFLVVELRREFIRQYKLDGPMRDNVMFQVVKAQNPREYRISVRGLDGKNTILGVDPVKKESTDCLLIRRTTAVQTVDFDPIYHDFKFIRPESALSITGVLDEFTYKRSVDDLYQHAQEEELVMVLTSRSIYNYGDDKLEIGIVDVHERRDKFRVKLDNQTMSVFHEINVPPGLCIGTMAGFNITEEKPPMVSLELKKGRDTTGKFKYKISGTIHAPPKSQVDYQVLFGWLEKLKLPFSAKLTIFARGDRMTKGDLPAVVSKQVINFHYIYEMLKDKGFKFENGEGDPEDTTITSYTLPVTGIITATTIGIKGEVKVEIVPIKRNSSLGCE